MSEQLKALKDIFPDLEIDKAILETKIRNVNLYKKTNQLVLNLIAQDRIDLISLYKFENYLKIRFKVKDVKIVIESNLEFNLDIEWNNIIKYLNAKHPMTRSILINSRPIIENNNIKVELAVKGKDFLIGGSFEKELEEIVLNFYGKKYKVDFVENIDEELVKKYEENTRRIERMAIELASQEIVQNEEMQENKKVKKEEKTNKENNPKQEVNAEENIIDKKEEIEEYTPLILGRSLNIREQVIKVEDVGIDSGKLCLDGEIINMDSRELKSGKFLVMFDLYDGTSTITCKSFVVPEKVKDVMGRLKGAKGIKIEGTAQFDPFAKELGVIANTIIETPGRKKEKRMDNASEKRVELHMHTQMSQMDAITSAKDLIKRAMSWGMKSIAITDHGVVQAFPDAHKLLGRDNPDMKVIYGVEAYLVPDKTPIVTNAKEQEIDTEYCVLDLETTGFSFRTEKITEVGIMKIKNGEVIDKFSTFVNPQKPIPYKVVEVTKITDDMVKDAPTINYVLPDFYKFCYGSILVGQNVAFDISFMHTVGKKYSFSFNHELMDTLPMAKELLPGLRNYKLGTIVEYLGISLENAHRALDDTVATAKVFVKLMQKKLNLNEKY